MTDYDDVIYCGGIPTLVFSNEPDYEDLDLEEMGLTPPDEGDWVRYENEF